MTNADLPPFMDTFHNVRRIFPLRGEDHELRHVGTSYFNAMRRFPLSAVQAGAEVWLQQGKRFPKPAEWIESIPPRRQVAEVHALSDADAIAHMQAERLGYEDAPCHCEPCQRAGVTDQPLRYVPDVEADGRDRKALIGERVVTTGHWAHGEELAGYYRAKLAFWAAMFERFGCETPKAKRRLKTTYEQRMKEILWLLHEPSPQP